MLMDFHGFFCVIDSTLASEVVQPDLLITAQLGDSVTLSCFCLKDEVSFIAWFKQPVGQKPQIIVKAYYLADGDFSDELKNKDRFHVRKEQGSFNLTISKTERSDSAVYYCAAVFYYEITFGQGTFLKFTDSNSRTVVQQVVSDPVHPGDSVTLQCTIDSETCAGEHSVYWFRHGSGESLPGLIYTHGNRSDECEKSPEAGSPTHGCVYSLPKRNLSRSDAGIYYCAVATCGDILFGNGTKLDIEGFDWGSEKTALVWLSIIRTGVLFCVLLMLTILYGLLRTSQNT
uniref:Ig-like domain-containing protein n=1 Tax=Scleropages formosus TaxID=113540 RepID=A0A8C9S6X9_SCLFO